MTFRQGHVMTDKAMARVAELTAEIQRILGDVLPEGGMVQLAVKSSRQHISDARGVITEWHVSWDRKLMHHRTTNYDFGMPDIHRTPVVDRCADLKIERATPSTPTSQN